MLSRARWLIDEENVSIRTRPFGRVMPAVLAAAFARCTVSIRTRPFGRVMPVSVPGVGAVERAVSIRTRPFGRVMPP